MSDNDLNDIDKLLNSMNLPLSDTQNLNNQLGDTNINVDDVLKLTEDYIPPVSSTKGATGHMMGAGGVTELIACIKALETGLLPPNLGFTAPDEACPLPLVTEIGRRAKLKAAMSNAFGFGGQNSSLIVGLA